MKTLLLIVVASSFLAIAGSTLAQAQVLDTIVADIPFAFTVKNTTLPAGRYTIKRLDSTNPGVMEITSADNSEKRIFLVGSAQANKEPDKSKLIFDRIGDRYFLSKIFEAGDSSGVELQKSRVERQLDEEGKIGQVQSVAVLARTATPAER
ncbi:MAG TPA: hypothetical protein VNS63_09260 [Blastocatellia bacterium]|nr:hypothetical protein [Blastocatellia bacterium]